MFSHEYSNLVSVQQMYLEKCHSFYRKLLSWIPTGGNQLLNNSSIVYEYTLNALMIL